MTSWNYLFKCFKVPKSSLRRKIGITWCSQKSKAYAEGQHITSWRNLPSTQVLCFCGQLTPCCFRWAEHQNLVPYTQLCEPK